MSWEQAHVAGIWVSRQRWIPALDVNVQASRWRQRLLTSLLQRHEGPWAAPPAKVTRGPRPQKLRRTKYLSPSLIAQSAKNLPGMQEIPGLGRCPGEGNGNPLQCSCLGNPTDRRSLACYSPWGCKRVRSDLATTICIKYKSTFLKTSYKKTCKMFYWYIFILTAFLSTILWVFVFSCCVQLFCDPHEYGGK